MYVFVLCLVHIYSHTLISWLPALKMDFHVYINEL